MKPRPKVYLAKKSMSVDLEYTMFRIETGKTYLDDGTTVFDVYAEDGLKNGDFELATRRSDTVVVSHPDA